MAFARRFPIRTIFVVISLATCLIASAPQSGVLGAQAATESAPESHSVPGIADTSSLIPQSMTPLCEDVYTGTLTSTYTITNEDGLVPPAEYHIANVDVELLSVSATRADVRVTSWLSIDSSAPYPLTGDPLPISSEYLEPQNNIQSDDPEMISAAANLTAGSILQAQAVDSILAYVRAHTSYATDAEDDALSVLRTGKSFCAGFANLAVGLLRAAGIPARVRVGCVAHYDGWYAGESGARHGWVEVYYPDAGWVASDPEISANMIDTAHIVGFVADCQEDGTVIERTSTSGTLSEDDERHLWRLATPFEQPVPHPFYSASVTGWDRYPLRATPSSLHLVMPVDPHAISISVQIEDLSCAPQPWTVSTDTPWLSPTVSSGASGQYAVLFVNPEGMAPGHYAGSITATAPASEPGQTLTRDVPVSLTISEDVVSVYLPLSCSD